MHLTIQSLSKQYRRDFWGLRDFEHRFGRCAEGMWLPDTAADTATLEALAEQGVRFTVLAPRQAARVRPLDDSDAAWTALVDASDGARQ